MNRVQGLIATLLLLLSFAPRTAPAQRILATADNEGHIGACGHCPGQAGMGGMAPRGELLKQLRDAKESLLVLDAGNALIGPDSAVTQGVGIVASMNELQYDAMNVAPADFFYGKDTTVKTLAAAKFAVVSANLLDEKSGQLLFKPYVVFDRDNQKTAIIGVAEAPVGIDLIPTLKQQLAGVKIDPPVAAITTYLPKAKADASQVVLLYYGTSRGLRQIRAQFGQQVAAIVVGGMRPDQAPPGVIASQTHGTSLASFKLPGGPLEQIAIQRTATTDAAPAEPAPKQPKRVSAHPDNKPQGLTGVKLTPEEVNAAIDRGAKFLWEYIKSEDMGKHQIKLGGQQEHLVAMLALVHSGALQKFPDFEPALRAYLTEAKSYQSLGTYEVGLLSMLIESYGDPAFFTESRNAAQYLVDAQGPQGTWTYNVTLPEDTNSRHAPSQVLTVLGGAAPRGGKRDLARLRDWSLGHDGDSSCAQFAILGLHSASRCNNPIADDVWQRNLDANTRRQIADEGGWGYQDEASGSYGSMTCAGICAVAIDRFELHQLPAEVDPRIERGLGWLDDHFSVSTNPEHSSYVFYYLYSLERVGRVLDTEFIGSHEWYPQGARYLIDQQKPDGRWLDKSASGDEPQVPTSFALLFLTRATPRLQVVEKHGGVGTLRAQVQSPPPAKIYVILDASGSMIEEMKGQRKFDIAKNAVLSLINALPDTTQLALRVYGNYKTSLDKDSDTDTTLEIPMGTLDRKVFATKLKALRARGKTPLTLSLTDAAGDLSTSESDPATLLLLTDGGEDTMPRRNPVKAADEIAKKPGLTFHIIGFDINQVDWGEQLRAMAEHGHGFYWPAVGADDLPAQMAAAVFGQPIGFSVLDVKGKLVTQGHFGQPVSLPEGRYHMTTGYAGRSFDTPFGISTDGTTAVLFDATQIPPGAAPTPMRPTAAPMAPVARFCTHCGGPLPPGAKFCPKCGEPVPR